MIYKKYILKNKKVPTTCELIKVLIHTVNNNLLDSEEKALDTQSMFIRKEVLESLKLILEHYNIQSLSPSWKEDFCKAFPELDANALNKFLTEAYGYLHQEEEQFNYLEFCLPLTTIVHRNKEKLKDKPTSEDLKAHWEECISKEVMRYLKGGLEHENERINRITTLLSNGNNESGRERWLSEIAQTPHTDSIREFLANIDHSSNSSQSTSSISNTENQTNTDISAQENIEGSSTHTLCVSNVNTNTNIIEY